MNDLERARTAFTALKAAAKFSGEVVSIAESDLPVAMYRFSGVPRTLRAHIAAMQAFVDMLDVTRLAEERK